MIIFFDDQHNAHTGPRRRPVTRVFLCGWCQDMDGHESAPPLRPPHSRHLERYIPSIRFAFEELNKDRAELELIVARMCREELFKTCWRDGAIRGGAWSAL
jgi:hypothetical protein